MAEFPTPHTPMFRRAEDASRNFGIVAIPTILLVLLALTLYALVFVETKPNNHDILLMVITFMTAKLSTIVDHYFGSSASAQRKEEIIGMQAKTMQAAQTTLSAVTAPTGEVKLQPGDEVKVEAVEP